MCLELIPISLVSLSCHPFILLSVLSHTAEMSLENTVKSWWGPTTVEPHCWSPARAVEQQWPQCWSGPGWRPRLLSGKQMLLCTAGSFKAPLISNWWSVMLKWDLFLICLSHALIFVFSFPASFFFFQDFECFCLFLFVCCEEEEDVGMCRMNLLASLLIPTFWTPIPRCAS